MTFSLLWLPDVLKEAGLKVALVPGWESRGRSEMGPVMGVLCHYTAGSRKGNMPTLDLLIKGREASPGAEALPGPLCQLGLGRDGTYYIVAAGRANHAGKGVWQGITTGNSNFIGIERRTPVGRLSSVALGADGRVSARGCGDSQTRRAWCGVLRGPRSMRHSESPILISTWMSFAPASRRFSEVRRRRRR